MSDVNRFGGTNVQLNMEQIEKMRAAAAANAAARGITLNNAPVPIPAAAPVVVPPAPVAPEVRTDIIRSPGGPATNPTDPPVRLYPHGTPPVVAPEQLPTPPAAVPAMPLATPRPPARFPTEDVPPVANVPAPTGPGGITLNSAPVAPGWAGTVGLPPSEASKAFDEGKDYQKMLAGIGEVAKGLKPKSNDAALAAATTISPMSVQANQPNQLSAELMNTILQSKRKPRGLTLTG